MSEEQERSPVPVFAACHGGFHIRAYASYLGAAESWIWWNGEGWAWDPNERVVFVSEARALAVLTRKASLWAAPAEVVPEVAIAIPALPPSVVGTVHIVDGPLDAESRLNAHTISSKTRASNVVPLREMQPMPEGHDAIGDAIVTAASLMLDQAVVARSITCPLPGGLVATLSIGPRPEPSPR